MSIEQKGKLIAAIIAHLKFGYRNKLASRDAHGMQPNITPFDEGDTFFRLAFMSDANLKKVAKAAGL